MSIPYAVPRNWIYYDRTAVFEELLRARAAVLALTQIPYQKSWAEELQNIQLKREVAGTSRIEGADFTEKELTAALRESPQNLETRSQRQAAAAVATYRWIAALPVDRPVDVSLIRDVHRRIVTGCDDDHCPPGELRTKDQNVTFGSPRHRGVDGGKACAEALEALAQAARSAFLSHDELIRALALHYHFAALHPFLDGNGRTARALEALLLQRMGLRDTLFIAMSNYYYENKNAYLKALADTRAGNHDLTPFLKFALKGIEVQCQRLLAEIQLHLKKALFRNTMTDLFGRLESPRKRVMSARHGKLLNLLLDEERTTLHDFRMRTQHLYVPLKNPQFAFLRDVGYLIRLGAVHLEPLGPESFTSIAINLDWPMQITETEFFKRVREMPKTKIHDFLSR